MGRRFLFTVVLCILSLCLNLPCRAGLRGPGKYCGVVVFDRWDSCTLYGGGIIVPYEKRRRLDWWAVRSKLAKMLMEDRVDIMRLATKLIDETPANGQEALFKFYVMACCGMDEAAIATLRDLKRSNPNLENYIISNIYNTACGFSEWKVARTAVELFADNISGLILDKRLLQHFIDSGWSVEKVDQWLAGMPAGRRNFWIRERLRFNEQHGRSGALVKKLSEAVRKNPEDIDLAITLLRALRYGGDRKRDLSWMGESVKPKLATQAARIAFLLRRRHNWETAVKFYQQALDKPLTKDEVLEIATGHQTFFAPDKLRAMFIIRIKEDMGRCLLKLGKNQEAQKQMLDAAELREKNHLHLNSRLAGEVQSSSGSRAVEKRILEKEKQNSDDPRYWLERAEYYRGLKQPDQEEEALQEGLSLTKPLPKPKQPFKGSRDQRSSLLSAYARFLVRQKRMQDAADLLLDELEDAPALSASSGTAASMLAALRKQVRPDDSVLWDWLAERPQWGNPEERLLWQMLKNARPDRLPKYFLRAEKLANGHDPSRSHILGWIMNRMNFPERSIPLLKYAVDNLQDEGAKESAGVTLFTSYLDTRDWERAERIFPLAAKQLTSELPEWHYRITRLAAASGNKADAMRLWLQTVNLCPARLEGLEVLAKAGLKKELEAFYRRMQKKMPASNVPARALAILEKTK